MPLLQKRLVRLIPGSAWNWIAVKTINNPTKKQNMTTLHLKKSISRSPSRLALLFIPLVLACFGLSPTVRAADETRSNANTGEGNGALQSVSTGSNNTGLGAGALFSLTTGKQNTATGAQALKVNTADENTADGFQALVKNTTGTDNTATGWRALFQNTEGGGNTATGFSALQNNTTGNVNTAVGDRALFNNTTGADNIALGSDAGTSVVTAHSVICIGSDGMDVSDSCFIGNIFGATSPVGVAVLINSDGRLGTMTSSARYKDEIKPIGKASEALFALKPVAFRYKKDIDPAGTPQLGLVAEDVEKVNPDLIVRDKEGKPYTVRYEQVNAMLLNEFLKEHQTVQELKSAAAKQGAVIANQQKQIEALSAGLQKVSAQVEMSRPAPQTVANNQ